MSIILGYKGGHPKQFLMKGGDHHILQELPIKSNQPPLPHKNERTLSSSCFPESLIHCLTKLKQIGDISFFS